MDYALLMKAQLTILNDLFKAAEAENRDLTEEEQNKYDAAEAEFNRLKALKEKADALANMSSSIPADPARVTTEPEPEPEPAAPASNANARINVGDNREVNRPYANIGGMLRDVVRATNNNGEARDRLIRASLSTETGSDGGFLVPEDFIGSLLEQAIGMSQLYSRTTEMPIEGNTANLPGVDETSRADGSRFGGIQVSWVREGDDGTYTKPKFRMLDIKLAKLMGLVVATDEMLEDSALLSSWIQAAFPAEMAFVLDQAVYDGDGNGKPLGILNSPALVEVAKVAGQTADTIVYENVISMWARMPASRISRAAWFVTQQALEQFPLMNLSVGTGGAPVYLPAGGASEAPYSTLLGRPIIPIEQATALGDKGDIIFADMSDYVSIVKSGVKGGVKTASSIHVYFDSAKTAFRFIRRVNGAPYTRVKLQSRSSSTFYTSPYITLAERA